MTAQEAIREKDNILQKYRKKWLEQPKTEPCKGLECKGKDCVDCILCHLENDIKQVAEEYNQSLTNDGWIPASAPPKKDGFYVVTFDGELCGEDAPFVGMCEFEDGEWLEDCILAWKEQEPYNPENVCDVTSKKQTNADKIRNMTDEELAEFLFKYSNCEYCCISEKCIKLAENNCLDTFLAWLQQEVEE